MEFIRLTPETLKWFEPILPEEYQTALKGGEVAAIGCVMDEKACGVLVFRLREGIADIVHLAVSDDCRRQGAARGMIGCLCDFAWRTTTPVRCVFSASNKSDPVYLLFAEMGTFTVSEEEGAVYRADRKALESSRLPVSHGRPGQKFFALPSADRTAFLNALRAAGILYLQGCERKNWIQPLCLCSLGPKGVEAAAFVERLPNADFLLSFAYCFPGKPAPLLGLLGEIREELLRSPGEESCLFISAVTPSSAALVEKLLPGCMRVERFYEAVWDMDPDREE